MEILFYIFIALSYIFFYTLASFLFNYKIFLVSNDKYNLGAFISGLGLFINFSLYAFVPYVAIALSNVVLSIIMLFALGLASFISNAIMTKIDFLHSKNEKDEEVK